MSAADEAEALLRRRASLLRRMERVKATISQWRRSRPTRRCQRTFVERYGGRSCPWSSVKRCTGCWWRSWPGWRAQNSSALLLPDLTVGRRLERMDLQPYMITRHGQPYITAGGLLYAAHERGVLAIRSQV